MDSNKVAQAAAELGNLVLGQSDGSPALQRSAAEILAAAAAVGDSAFAQALLRRVVEAMAGTASPIRCRLLHHPLQASLAEDAAHTRTELPELETSPDEDERVVQRLRNVMCGTRETVEASQELSRTRAALLHRRHNSHLAFCMLERPGTSKLSSDQIQTHVTCHPHSNFTPAHATSETRWRYSLVAQL